MTDTQKFWKLLDHYPYIKGYWNRTGSGELDIERAKQAIKGRRGDAVLLSALAAIWLGGLNTETKAFKIDFTDLYAVVDPHDRKPLLEWLIDPYWP